MKKIILTGSFFLVTGVAAVMAQSTTISNVGTVAPATEVKSCSKSAKASCCKAGEEKACCKDKSAAHGGTTKAASSCSGHVKAEAAQPEEKAAPK